MNRYRILSRMGRILGELDAESRRKAVADAKARNAAGDRQYRGAYRAQFLGYSIMTEGKGNQ